jgi:HSF-type DNA-binding
METEKESSKKDTSTGASSLPDGNGAKTNGGNGAPSAAAAVTADAKKPPSTSNAKDKGPRRQSTRSVKAPKPFSPPMGGIKGVSATAKKALASSSKKGSSSTVSLNNVDRGRFMPILYDLIEETHNEDQDIISWSRDGKSFVINHEHDDLEAKIEEYFSRKFVVSLCGVSRIIF